MGVHNISKYVEYHRQKLRNEQEAAASKAAQSRRQASTSTRRTVTKLTRMDDYKSQVAQSSGVTVIDFFATWCGPCKVIAPVIAKWSEEDDELKDSVKFFKIDVDEAPEIAQEFGIRAMPTFAILKDGEKVDEVVGANPNELRKRILAVVS